MFWVLTKRHDEFRFHVYDSAAGELAQPMEKLVRSWPGLSGQGVRFVVRS
jgi:hypothetical protein